MSQGSTLVLPDVTLCTVDTVHPSLALAALRHCMTQVHFARVVFYTDRAKLQAETGDAADLDGIDIVDVRIASRDEYSLFLLQGLQIDTSHVLIVQWDGWILDPTAWRPEFLDYDYIGSPWPPRADLSRRLDVPIDELRVGNGGFSLRSRRLLQVLASGELQLFHPEDQCICHHHRTALTQRYGMRFADVELATQFSYERPWVPRAFGFHGIFNFHHVMDRPALYRLLQQLPDNIRRHNETRKLIVQLLDLGWLPEAALLIDARWRSGMRDLRTLRLRTRLAWGRLRNRPAAAL